MVADGSRSTETPGGRFASDPFGSGHSVASVGMRVRELVEFGSYYVTAQIDRAKLTAISIAMFVLVGLILAFVGVAVVLTAGVLLVTGIAGAIGALFNGRLWLGELITSVVILGGLVAGVLVVFKTVLTKSRKKVVAAYEQRKSQQRSDLGTDVDEQAGR